MLSVALTPDGQWVLSGSKDRGVQFWDPRTGSAQLMLQGHKNSGTCVLDPSEHSPGPKILPHDAHSVSCTTWVFLSPVADC